ncbi:MAG: site-specific DNA-methyltransferase [Fimbriimonadia bacterium]|jgi:hypothetical protein
MKPWGPDNPHPLFTMKTELVWEGKYDEYGNRRPVSLPDFPLVLQKVETVDAPRDAARAEQPGLFDEAEFCRSAHRDDFRNMLIWGDNKLVCTALLKELREKVGLVYIDPPFDVGADFTAEVVLDEDTHPGAFKNHSVLEEVAFRDLWGQQQNSYLSYMSHRLALLHELLSEEGVLVFHCDWRVNSAMRLLLDELFGSECYRNEVVWRRAPGLGRTVAANQLGRNVDSLLVYSKSPGTKMCGEAPEMLVPIETTSTGTPKGAQWDEERKCYFTLAPRGDYTDESVARLETEGRVYRSGGGQVYIKYFLERAANGGWAKRQKVDVLWADSDVRPLRHCSQDELGIGFPTQKPEGLLARVISWATREGDLVADFFCGSGTTMAVAEKLGRRWIGCDLGRYAIHTTRKRLIGVQRELHAAGKPYRSFDVYNLGRYERQWWQMERLQGADEQHRATVLKFFRAAPLDSSPSPLLHGTKGGAYVYVDSIDSIMTADKVRAVAEAAKFAGGRRVVCLAWEFEMNLRLRIAGVVKDSGVDISLKYIPREIMEANRNEVQFFDAGAVEAEALVHKHPKSGKHAVDVRLTNFIPSLAEVPERELEVLRERAVRSPFDFIDFWAVDFEHRDDKPFEHHWQDYRTRKDRSLKTESDCYYTYPNRGRKRICVKVIDVFGVDTTTVIEVDA